MFTLCICCNKAKKLFPNGIRIQNICVVPVCVLCLKASTIWKSKNKKRVHQTTKMLNEEIMCYSIGCFQGILCIQGSFLHIAITHYQLLLYSFRLNWNWFELWIGSFKIFSSKCLEYLENVSHMVYQWLNCSQHHHLSMHFIKYTKYRFAKFMEAWHHFVGYLL